MFETREALSKKTFSSLAFRFSEFIQQPSEIINNVFACAHKNKKLLIRWWPFLMFTDKTFILRVLDADKLGTHNICKTPMEHLMLPEPFYWVNNFRSKIRNRSGFSFTNFFFAFINLFERIWWRRPCTNVTGSILCGLWSKILWMCVCLTVAKSKLKKNISHSLTRNLV